MRKHRLRSQIRIPRSRQVEFDFADLSARQKRLRAWIYRIFRPTSSPNNIQIDWILNGGNVNAWATGLGGTYTEDTPGSAGELTYVIVAWDERDNRGLTPEKILHRQFHYKVV